MRTQRQIVDYALRRRALLREVYSGRVGTYEVCDASPYLRSAAKFHGEPREERCPVCRRENLTNVHYIDAYLAMLKTVMEQTAGVRRPGSAAWVSTRAWTSAAGTSVETSEAAASRTARAVMATSAGSRS